MGGDVSVQVRSKLSCATFGVILLKETNVFGVMVNVKCKVIRLLKILFSSFTLSMKVEGFFL